MKWMKRPGYDDDIGKWLDELYDDLRSHGLLGSGQTEDFGLFVFRVHTAGYRDIKNAKCSQTGMDDIETGFFSWKGFKFVETKIPDQEELTAALINFEWEKKIEQKSKKEKRESDFIAAVNKIIALRKTLENAKEATYS